MLQASGRPRQDEDTKAVVESKGDDNLLWIRKIVASVSNRPLSDVAVEDKLADLGFDSLMFVELQAAVEDAGGRVISPDTLNEVQTVRELLTAVNAWTNPKDLLTNRRAEEKKEDDEIDIPSLVRRVGNAVVDLAQETLYSSMCSTLRSRAKAMFRSTLISSSPRTMLRISIPALVKKALGKDVAEQTVAVAAADYWFDTKYKRAYMNNFTTLVPIERRAVCASRCGT